MPCAFIARRLLISVFPFCLPRTCRIEKDEGPAHDKKFVSSVQIATTDGVLFMMGEEKSRVKDAENCAASLMIRALQESTYL